MLALALMMFWALAKAHPREPLESRDDKSANRLVHERDAAQQDLREALGRNASLGIELDMAVRERETLITDREEIVKKLAEVREKLAQEQVRAKRAERSIGLPAGTTGSDTIETRAEAHGQDVRVKITNLESAHRTISAENERLRTDNRALRERAEEAEALAGPRK